MTANELRKARALYIGHRLVIAVYIGSTLIAARHLGLLKNAMDFGDWMAYLGFFLVVGFVVTLVANPLFKRKSRPWHLTFRTPPEDRWPRA